MNDVMEKIVSLSKRRGFIYPGSEIYGGLANTYDYGPVGAELLRNIRNLWWDTFVHKRDDIVGLEASIISHQEVWHASGHATGFSDALIDCRNCKLRMRADHLIEESEKEIKVEGLSPEKLSEIIRDKRIVCPSCGKFNWTDVRKFNLLFPVQLGIVEGDKSLAYLRGETAQGMFINFKNVISSTRVRLPFGIAQLGKSFRNEITPGNSVFRTLEFELAEIEYFFDEDRQNWEELFEDWKKEMFNFITKTLGISEEKIRWREHGNEERSFYSKRTEDLEYEFPFGYKELWGLAYRTDYDLKQHIKFSKEDLSITDPETGKKIIPHVIEPAVGINRLLLTVLCDAYTEDNGRILLRLNPKLAPYKAAVFPLLANKPELVEKAKKVYDNLKKIIPVYWDARGNIGKRYLYQDEIGTPYCLTIDFDTLVDDTITVRDRDSAKQERIKVSEVEEFINNKINA
ncbi:MAG: glycine--tRNA ligase [Candidatus Levyibacteriota bacterium]